MTLNYYGIRIQYACFISQNTGLFYGGKLVPEQLAENRGLNSRAYSAYFFIYAEIRSFLVDTGIVNSQELSFTVSDKSCRAPYNSTSPKKKSQLDNKNRILRISILRSRILPKRNTGNIMKSLVRMAKNYFLPKLSGCHRSCTETTPHSRCKNGTQRPGRRRTYLLCNHRWRFFLSGIISERITSRTQHEVSAL